MENFGKVKASFQVSKKPNWLEKYGSSFHIMKI